MSATARALLVAGALAATPALAPASHSASAQVGGTLSAACRTAGGTVAACRETALAAGALAGHLGLASGVGSEVSGTSSTLGQRLGTSPRVSFSGRIGALRTALPDVLDAGTTTEVAFTLPSVHAGVTLGLFDGVRLMPTAGGFGSVDVFVGWSLLFLPTERGFADDVSSYTVGARVGMLREGFTVPGISVSAARRFVGQATIGDAARPAVLAVDPSVTSLRATIGKDILAVEVMAGVGWEDYSADATYAVTNGAGGTVTGAEAVDATRTLYFLGAATSFSIVFSLSAEVGLAQGFDPLAGYVGAFDAAGGTWFGSLALRLTI